MKGDKAQTRPERRTPPLRETHEGRQMKETRRGHHHSRRHVKGDKCRETNEGKRDRQDRRGGHHHSGRHMMGVK